MTNLPWRIQIGSLAFWIHRAGTRYWWFMAHLLGIPAKLIITVAQSTSRRRLEKLRRAADDLHDRVISITPELQTLDLLTPHRKNELLAAHSALLREAEQLQGVASKMTSYRPPGASVLLPPMTYVQRKLISRQSKTHSFRKIIARVDCDTFYWDLLLWLVLPGGYSEALLGDLNEEYMLRHSSEGEAGARIWYRNQTTLTLKDFFWKNIERWAALGTLIDLLDRWLRK